jgi:hypothetical protein
LPAADADGADLTEKPTAIVAWSHRTESRMKITNCFVLLREMNSKARRRIPIEFGENIGFHLGMAGRTLARVPWDKQINRQWLTAVRTTQISGHLT